MRQYIDVVKDVLETGVYRDNPHNKDLPGSIGKLGLHMRFNLEDGFPLITTRNLKGSWKALVHELLWFLSGSTSVGPLNEAGVHLWDMWGTPEITTQYGYQPGELGPIYGHQWRNFGATRNPDGTYQKDGFDQISRLVDDLINRPDSKRHMVTTWSPIDADRVFIAPCHGIFKCFVADGKLSLHMFQRSADIPVGVPFNIASYSLLLMMLAQVTGLKAHEFVHTISDGHIYSDQVDAMNELVQREPLSLPSVKINPAVKNIFDFKFEDFELVDYSPHPSMKIPVTL